MVACIVACLVSAAAGFGAGRVKNAAKLAKVEAVIAQAENTAKVDAKKLITAVRSHL